MDDNICKNVIYSNDYYDLIIDYIGGYPLGDPECILQVDNTYDIGFYSRERAPELNLVDYPYLTIPHCLVPMDMTALEVSGILRLQNPSALDLQGQGVLIGFVDTGITYEHPAFQMQMERHGLLVSGIRRWKMEHRRMGWFTGHFMERNRSMKHCGQNARGRLCRNRMKTDMVHFWQVWHVEAQMARQIFREQHR